jgi:hypothetical protein
LKSTSLGHSLTLFFGVLENISVNAYIIDAIIGLSVVYKGFDNLGGFQRLFARQPRNGPIARPLLFCKNCSVLASTPCAAATDRHKRVSTVTESEAENLIGFIYLVVQFW